VSKVNEMIEIIRKSKNCYTSKPVIEMKSFNVPTSRLHTAVKTISEIDNFLIEATKIDKER
jgi:hypothetical protein